MREYEGLATAEAEARRIEAESIAESESIENAIAESEAAAVRAAEESEAAAKAEAEKSAKEILENSEFSSGQYKVGTDIPSGEYMVIANGKGYFCVSSDSNGNDIIFNDNFETNSIITIKDGEYLNLSRCTAYPFDAYCELNTIDTTKPGTMLKIGVNLDAGEYKLSADDRGYYCIFDSSRHDNIIANDNFTGQAYVTVKDGQYLVLSRCTIAQ